MVVSTHYILITYPHDIPYTSNDAFYSPQDSMVMIHNSTRGDPHQCALRISHTSPITWKSHHEGRTCPWVSPRVFVSISLYTFTKEKTLTKEKKKLLENSTPIFPSFPHVYLRKNLTKDMQDVFEVQDIKVAEKPSEMVMEEMEETDGWCVVHTASTALLYKGTDLIKIQTYQLENILIYIYIQYIMGSLWGLWGGSMSLSYKVLIRAG